MTREVKILCGIPGVGKSTWASKEVKFLEADGYTTAIISRDAIRFALLEERGGDDYFAYEDEVFDKFIHDINEAIALGIDYVFVDATHINFRSRMKTLRRLTVDEHTTVVFEVFNFPLEVALYRNGQREGITRVPVSAVKSMWRGFHFPDEHEVSDIKNTLKWANEFTVHAHRKEE